MTNFFLKRFASNSTATLGLLFFEKEFFCFSLEDEFREVKVSGETRIPAGKYKIRPAYNSGLLNRMRANGWYTFDWIPTICDVPGFTNIRIHAGNTEAHTDGCPLLGMSANSHNFTIGRSRDAVLKFVEQLETCFNDGEVYLTITDER